MPFIGNQPTAIPLASSDLEDNIISTAKIQDNAVTAAKYVEPIPFRNIIINGDMSIDQRNSGSSVTATNGGYTIDRWLTGSSQSSKFTVDQETDAPTGFSYSVKLTSSAATTPGASDQYWFAQNIEGFNTAYLEYGNSNAKTVTVSFHVKSSLTGTFSGSLMNSAYNYSHPFTYSISSANTWEKKSVVITGATAGTWIGATNGVGIRMYFSLGNGSNFLGTAGSWSASQNNGATGETQFVATSGATLFITGVQLEAGTTASDFEFLPVDVNLQRCQRYYQTTQSFVGNGSSNTSQCVGETAIGIPMRATPSLSLSGNFVITDGYTSDYTQSSASIGVYSNSAETRSFMVIIQNLPTLTTAKPYHARHSNSSVIQFSSEL